jgi:Swt1-like HEPN
VARPPTVPHLNEILGSRVPPDALAFYGRWWQLETWLRELVYVELRAKYGVSWTRHLEGRAPARAAGDTANAYMASADSGELLAYADVSDLFGLIEDQWAIFSPFLPPRRRWEGASDELRELRNRNAHCRRPHQDDLARLEQVLRNLEVGAQLFYTSYHDTHPVYGSRDPVAQSWVEGGHETAQRLLDHADRQYDVRFRLSYSTRPWAAVPQDEDSLSGHEGVLWHAMWILSGREVNVAELWSEVARPGLPRDALVHLLVNLGRVTATFAAVDDPDRVSDEIGHTFDDVLVVSREQDRAASTDEFVDRWTHGGEMLPRRVQTMSPLSLADEPSRSSISVFAA